MSVLIFSYLFSKYREGDIICPPLEILPFILGGGVKDMADDDESVHDADVAFSRSTRP